MSPRLASAALAGERALLVAGCLATLVYGASIAQSRLYQAEAERVFERSIREKGAPAMPSGVPFSLRDFGPLLASRAGFESAVVDTADWSPTKVRAYEGRFVLGAPPPLARLQIPSIGVSAMVLEGTDETALIRGIGHIAGTALPGEPGNVGLAGHRDSFFRRLEKLHEGAPIVLTTLDGRDVRYVTESIDIVSPDRVDLLHPSGDSSLTLVTCYPFYFIGAAPLRYVVRATQSAEGLGVVTPWPTPGAPSSVK